MEDGNDHVRAATKRGAVWRLLRRLARAAGIPVKMSPHVLRHLCHSLPVSCDAGARLEDIQDQLNHADPRTTPAATTTAAPGSTVRPPTPLAGYIEVAAPREQDEPAG